MSTMTLEEKVDEALRETFPAGDAFAVSPDAPKRPIANDEPAVNPPQQRTPHDYE